ncbi:MAG: transcriptional regulator [Verrucomicrobiota bacterium]|nr:transcriptional regulator [Verrucomicrobiota bacterium]
MFRKDLIPLLLQQSMTVSEIARWADQPPGEVLDDIEHLLRSIKHTEYRPVVEVAACKKCGFQFSPDKLRKPSKCPECKSTWLTEPRVRLERK